MMVQKMPGPPIGVVSEVSFLVVRWRGRGRGDFWEREGGSVRKKCDLN